MQPLTNAAASATDSSNAASTWSNYYNTYVGASSSEPTVDVQGNALVAGALYCNTTNNTTYVWTGSAWNAVANNNIINPNVALTQDLATNGNDVKFGDNDKATFGAGDDLQIYHDGSNSVISDGGTGSLLLRGSNVWIQNADGTETGARFITDGAIDLRHNNSIKLATTSTGIDVTGEITADGLTVEAASDALIRISDSSSVNQRLDLQHNGNLSRIISGNNGTYGTLKIQGYNGTDTVDRFKIAADGDVSFYEDTGTTPKFFWDASAESLQLSGAGGLEVNPSSGIAAINLTSNNSQTWTIYSPDASYDLRFKSDSIDYVTIDSIGKVGIGTSSPSAELSVSNGGVESYEISPATVIGGTIRQLAFNRSSSAYIPFRTQASQHEFYAGSSEAMRIDSSGNVGIGTDSPSAKLAIQTGGDEGIRLFRTNANANFGAIEFRNSTDTATNSRIGWNNNELRLEATSVISATTNGAERMRIDSSGNVGIGTSSPNEKLG